MADKVRTYKAAVERERAGLSGEQIAAAKNRRCRERHGALRKLNQYEAYLRKCDQDKLTPDQQWRKLDCRLGQNRGAIAERIRLAKAMNRQYEVEENMGGHPTWVNLGPELN